MTHHVAGEAGPTKEAETGGGGLVGDHKVPPLTPVHVAVAGLVRVYVRAPV